MRYFAVSRKFRLRSCHRLSCEKAASKRAVRNARARRMRPPRSATRLRTRDRFNHPTNLRTIAAKTTLKAPPMIKAVVEGVDIHARHFGFREVPLDIINPSLSNHRPQLPRLRLSDPIKPLCVIHRLNVRELITPGHNFRNRPNRRPIGERQ